jgi:hypothetical protein
VAGDGKHVLPFLSPFPTAPKIRESSCLLSTFLFMDIKEKLFFLSLSPFHGICITILVLLFLSYICLPAIITAPQLKLNEQGKLALDSILDFTQWCKM